MFNSDSGESMIVSPMKIKAVCLAASLPLMAFLSITAAQAAALTVDPAQTKVAFQVKGVGGASGSFSKFQGTANYNPDNIKDLKINFVIDSNSINAGAKTAIYKGDKVFDVSDYPTLTFRSTQVTPKSANVVKVDGLLTMHGVTKLVSWNMQIDPARSNEQQLHFTANTSIKRSQWGMDGYSKLASDQVDLNIQAKLRAEI